MDLVNTENDIIGTAEPNQAVIDSSITDYITAISNYNHAKLAIKALSTTILQKYSNEATEGRKNLTKTIKDNFDNGYCKKIMCQMNDIVEILEYSPIEPGKFKSYLLKIQASIDAINLHTLLNDEALRLMASEIIQSMGVLEDNIISENLQAEIEIAINTNPDVCKAHIHPYSGLVVPQYKKSIVSDFKQILNHANEVSGYVKIAKALESKEY